MRQRIGAINPAQLVIFAGMAILCVVLLANAYKFFVPSAYTIDKTDVVEALEVMKGVSPLRKNGVPLAQAESLRGGGSSRLVVTRPAADGAFELATGKVSHGFVAGKLPLDKMLHLAVNANEIIVTCDGQPVQAVLLVPRTETNPLRVDAVSSDPEVDVVSTLFTNQTLLPAPAGTTSPGKFVSNNGMSVDTGLDMGKTGAVSLGEALELAFTIDPLSSAWVEMPRTVRLQHTAVGSEDLLLGILIPRNTPGTGAYKVTMFGEEVASIPRK